MLNVKTQLTKNTLHDSYKILRNQIKLIIQNSKNIYYQNYFTNNNKNLRKIWAGIKSIISNKNNGRDIPSCILKDDNLISEIPQISNSLTTILQK